MNGKRTPTDRQQRRLWRPLLIWAATVIWTAFLIFLMVSPGEESTADDISGFFGGTELTDAAGHIILFMVLTLLWQRALVSHTTYRRSLVAALAIGLGLGLATEIAQLFIPDRGGGLADILADWLGAGAAAALVDYRRR